MRIGVLGDTHNNLRSVHRIVEIFNRASVEHVVHTGDITQVKVLEALTLLDAPLHGVYGNNDEGERGRLEPAALRLGIELADGPLELNWHERHIVVVHDPRELESALRPEHHLALHGHTHLYRNERVNGAVVFNPGECAGQMEGYNAVGIVDLRSLECTLERF